MNEQYFFNNVSLLITHYNRTGSLIRLLSTFQQLGCRFGEIVVSDDGSRPDHLTVLEQASSKFGFRLVTTPINRGLGNNINKGQDAVCKDYTLYIQEDFVPGNLFPEKLKEAVRLMDEDSGLDMARFYAYFKYPYLQPVSAGFSEMRFRLWLPGYRKFYMYSDHPHLRRSTFFSKFGRYQEGLKGDVTEYRMMMSFLQQGGRGLFYEDYTGLLDQMNSEAEPSTMKRNMWRESNNWLIAGLRHAYRHLRFNFDYLFGKFTQR